MDKTLLLSIFVLSVVKIQKKKKRSDAQVLGKEVVTEMRKIFSSICLMNCEASQQNEFHFSPNYFGIASFWRSE